MYGRAKTAIRASTPKKIRVMGSVLTIRTTSASMAEPPPTAPINASKRRPACSLKASAVDHDNGKQESSGGDQDKVFTIGPCLHWRWLSRFHEYRHGWKQGLSIQPNASYDTDSF